MSYRIRPEDWRFIEEFRTHPIGRHSPGLTRLLTALRRSPDGRQLVLLTTVPFREWVVAWLPARRCEAIEIERDRVYTDREQAEWAVFCRRWKDRTGQSIT